MIGAIRSTGIRRLGTKQTFLFIPNDDRFKFESEKLTPEENRAAIPRRPKFDHLPKYHHEITSPENVADFLSRPQFNDLFTTTLAKNAPFTGDSDLKMATMNGDDTVINLYYTITATKWFEVFNNEILELREIDDEVESLSFFNKDTHAKTYYLVSTARKELKADLFTFQGLDELFNTLLKGSNIFRYGSQSLSFGSLANYFLHSDECVKSSHNLVQLLTYIDQHIHEMTAASTKSFVTKLADVVYHTHVSDIRAKLEGLLNFSNNPTIRTALKEVDSATLDRLAYLHTMSSSFDEARAMLHILVQERKVAPSAETFDFFLSSYLKHVSPISLSPQLHSKVLRELKLLKPALFHRGITPAYAKRILDEIVISEFDLQQFINLVLSNRSSDGVLRKICKDLVSKAIQLGKDQPLAIRSLKVSNLIERLKASGTLDKEAIEEISTVATKI